MKSEPRGRQVLSQCRARVGGEGEGKNNIKHKCLHSNPYAPDPGLPPFYILAHLVPTETL